MSKLWKKPANISSWRKISVGMWGRPADPTIYGFEILNVEPLLRYLDEVTEASGTKVTMTAFMTKTISNILSEHPKLNSIVVGNQVLQRENIDAFCQVAVSNDAGGSADLSGAKIRNSDRLSLPEIAEKLHRRADRIRKGQDKEIEQTKSMLDKIPPAVLPQLMRVVDVLTYAVPFDLGKLGIRDDPFGSFMVTNCAPFDIRLGFAPLVPFARTPIVVLMGIVEDHVFAEDGKPVVRKGCQMSFTADHRCYDGLQVGILTRKIRACIEDPYSYFPAPETYGEGSKTTDADVAQSPTPEASTKTPVGS